MHAFHREFELPESHMNQLHLAGVAMVTRAPQFCLLPPSRVHDERGSHKKKKKKKLRCEEGISVFSFLFSPLHPPVKYGVVEVRYQAVRPTSLQSYLTRRDCADPDLPLIQAAGNGCVSADLNQSVKVSAPPLRLLRLLLRVFFFFLFWPPPAPHPPADTLSLFHTCRMHPICSHFFLQYMSE